MGCGSSKNRVHPILVEAEERESDQDSDVQTQSPQGNGNLAIEKNNKPKKKDKSAQILNTLASYLPRTLIHYYHQNPEPPKEPRMEKLKIAILFVDISGYILERLKKIF